MIDKAALEKTLEEFIANSESELNARWAKWNLDLSRSEVQETIGGLLARQVTLATTMASTPSLWTPHSAPALLRVMIDAHITLAWICGDPDRRAKEFILYGLGQTKLEIEHRRVRIEKGEASQKEIELTEYLQQWLDSQQFDFLTEVNLGSWSGLSTREMAEEADLVDFYNYCYTPFSAATHSLWHHIGKFNLVVCEEPLHGYHRIPANISLPLDPHYVFLAAKYQNKSFERFDRSFSVSAEVTNSFDVLQQRLLELFSGDRNRDKNEDAPN